MHKFGACATQGRRDMFVASEGILQREHAGAEYDSPAAPGWILAGAGAAGLASGIYLLAVGRNRVSVTPIASRGPNANLRLAAATVEVSRQF